MFGDELCSQSRKSSKMTATDSTKEGRWGRTTKGSVMVNSKLGMRFIKAQDTIDLMTRRQDGRSVKWNRPKTVRIPNTSDNKGVVF
jgi:hypothetical protein